MNIKESFSIILHFIQKNIATGLLDMGTEVQLLDPKRNTKYEFTSFSQDEARKFFYQKEYKKLLTAEDDTLSIEQKQQKEELQKFANECTVDGSHVISEHRKIQEHYLDKKETYGIEDVEMIVSTLKDMQVDSALCDSIKIVLIKEIEKREKKETVNRELFRVSQKSTILSKKEYYALKKEVQEYENAMNENYMSVSDSIHLVYLLQQLNYKENEIKDILKKIDKKNKQQNFDKINPIVQYNDLYNKLKFYSDKGYGIEKLKELEGYFQEIFIVNDEEYATYKGWLAETLQTTLEIIPNNYEYELQEATTYIKK